MNVALTKELKNKTVLITGGAGSLGSALTAKLLEYPVHSVRVLDIDEYALFRLSRQINDSRLRMLLGNVIDNERIEIAGNGVDIVFHVAAIKNIEISEWNPIETIDTNINGTVNMIKMAVKNKLKKFVNISTDKAASPSTLYGTTKQIGERLTSWAGEHVSDTKFCSVRLGNIIESRGNVFEIWDEEKKQNKPLSLTSKNMRRFFFHMNETVNFILECLLLTNAGEIFIPKMNSCNMYELAKSISKKYKIIGIRQGEKLYEELITSDEKKIATEKKNMWILKTYFT